MGYHGDQVSIKSLFVENAKPFKLVKIKRWHQFDEILGGAQKRSKLYNVPDFNNQPHHLCNIIQNELYYIKWRQVVFAMILWFLSWRCNKTVSSKSPEIEISNFSTSLLYPMILAIQTHWGGKPAISRDHEFSLKFRI